MVSTLEVLCPFCSLNLFCDEENLLRVVVLCRGRSLIDLMGRAQINNIFIGFIPRERNKQHYLGLSHLRADKNGGKTNCSRLVLGLLRLEPYFTF